MARDMKAMIESFNEQVREGWALGSRADIPPFNSKRINIMGMGGSALPGDFLRCFSDGYAISVHRDYGYSKECENGLNVCISYSGNTEETVDAFDSIIARGLPCMAMSSGGKLKEKAHAAGVPFIQLPSGLVPRVALPLMSTTLVAIASRGGLLSVGDADVELAAQSLDAGETSSIGMRISLAVRDRIPLFYASSRNEILAKIGKIAVNENAKAQAFYNVFPELNHNEMNGFEVVNGKFTAVFIHDDEDHPQNIKRMKITHKLIEERSIPVVELRVTGKNRLHKMLRVVQAQFWASYHLANYYGVDAVNVPVVEQFKKELLYKGTFKL